MHVRQQIREAFAALLLADINITASIYTSRTVVLQDNELPAIIITTNSEQVQVVDMHGQAIERNLEIEVSIKVKASINFDDALDTFAEKIEKTTTANLAAKNLGGLCQSLQLESLDMALDESLETPVGQMNMRFACVYFTAANNPSIAL